MGSNNNKMNNGNLSDIIHSNSYQNIKSKYILKQILENLHKKRLLQIIKYSKIIQEKINIGVNDFKKYNEIEIEIFGYICDKNQNKISFINIPEADRPYYHIYFNNDENESKYDFFSSDEKLIKIRIIIDYNIKSFDKLFHMCIGVRKISFIRFNRKNITSMYSMFSGCPYLREINFNQFRTDNVTNMRSMFSGCTSLEKLNLYFFNTKNVINMSCMFYRCSSLTELNINFDTSNVTDMSYMFFGCKALNKINLDNFNTNKVSKMWGMFDDCSNELKMQIKESNKNIRVEAFS